MDNYLNFADPIENFAGMFDPGEMFLCSMAQAAQIAIETPNVEITNCKLAIATCVDKTDHTEEICKVKVLSSNGSRPVTFHWALRAISATTALGEGEAFLLTQGADTKGALIRGVYAIFQKWGKGKGKKCTSTLCMIFDREVDEMYFAYAARVADRESTPHPKRELKC